MWAGGLIDAALACQRFDMHVAVREDFVLVNELMAHVGVERVHLAKFLVLGLPVGGCYCRGEWRLGRGGTSRVSVTANVLGGQGRGVAVYVRLKYDRIVAYERP